MSDVFQQRGFEVDEVIGRGGMAEVFLATQTSLGRKVALKVMDANLGDETFTERFLNEGRLIASLNHPNVITIHDIGVLDDGRYFISMEYVNGGDLEERLKQGPLLESEAVAILKDLLACLQLVHERGIIHRDVKPANILFREDGSLVLTDFGIAKELTGDVKLTQEGGTLGSPSYMSPEQAQGKRLSNSSDIYSAGVVFLEMLSGENPYEGDSFVTTSMNHIQMEIPELPVEYQRFQPVLEKMLSKDPNNRYDYVGDIFSDLDACVAGEFVAKKSSGKTPVKKHSQLIAFGLVVVCVSVASWFYFSSPSEDGNIKALERVGDISSETDAGKASEKDKQDAWVMEEEVIKVEHQNEFLDDVSVEEGKVKPEVIAEKESFFSKMVNPHKQEIDRFLRLAKKSEDNGNLLSPQGANAHFYYQEILKLDDGNNEAKKALFNMRSFFVDMGNKAYADDRLMTPKGKNAYFYYQQAEKVDGRDNEINAAYKKMADRYARLTYGALDSMNVAKAKQYINRGLTIDPNHQELKQLREQAKVKKMPKRFFRNIGRGFKEAGEKLID